MKETKKYKLFFAAAITAAALILQCLPPLAAAEEPSEHAVRNDEIQTIFDTYVADHDLNPDMISVAYIYTGTEEAWYHLPDTWYYSASLYKVPLMMILAEREYNGEMEKDSLVNGIPLDTVEEEVLINSNNDIAYSTMLYIAQPQECRAMFQRYSTLEEEYYDWNFYSYSYFTARFMTDVMNTLYQQKERFPRLIEYMKQAQPGHYFRMSIVSCDVAQKYGCYHDEDGNDWNHTAGIIYTQVPFILTVMTRYGGISENIISDLAALFFDYTVSVTEKLQSVQPELPLPTMKAEDSEAEESQHNVTEEQVQPELESDSIEADRSELQNIPEQDKNTDKVESIGQEKNNDSKLRMLILVGCSGITLLLIVFTTVIKKKSR